MPRPLGPRACLSDIFFERNTAEDACASVALSDAATSHLVAGLRLFAIVIASLGLLGLSSFAAERRIKEVAVRKVLGASTSSLVRLLAGEFLLLISVAAVVALPVAALLMQRWLEGFSYRTPLHTWLFAAAVLLVLLVALVTAAGQAMRVARRNPVSSLRYE